MPVMNLSAMVSRICPSQRNHSGLAVWPVLISMAATRPSAASRMMSTSAPERSCQWYRVTSAAAQVSWRRSSPKTKVSASWPVAGSVGSSSASGVLPSSQAAGPGVVDGLPFERGVVDDALHDQFAARARGEQPEQLAHLGDLAESGQLDDVALDGGQHVVPERARPLPGGEPAHLWVAAGAGPFQRLPG